MTHRALNADEQVNFESLQGDLETLQETAEDSIPIPEISDDFLRHLVRQGSAFATLPRTFLARCGYKMPAPDELDDQQLAAELWKVIWIMGLLRMFLEHTDHLSDRELYTFLYEDALQEPTAFNPGEETPPFYTIDPTSGGSQDGLRTFLTFYGDTLDPEARDDLAGGLDGESIVAQPCPYDRDHLLP